MRRLLLLSVLALGATACASGDAVETSIVATNESTTIAPSSTSASSVTSTVPGKPGRDPRNLANLEALVTPELGSPLPAISRSFDIEVTDLNGDGHDDIIFIRHQNRKVASDGPDGFWLWTPDGYELLFLLPMLQDRHGCAAGDVNDDGATDVYCQLGGYKGSGILKSNELWIQTAPGVFEDQATDWGVDDPSGRGRWPVMLDFNNDGLLDLYVTNDGDRSDDLRSENMLWRNTGESFEEVVTDATGNWGSRCLNAVDFNGDGWTDLTMCDEGGNAYFFQNDNGTGFSDVSATMYEGRRSWKDMAFGDLDDDGDLDLVLVGPKLAQIRLNKGADKWFTKSAHKVALGDRGWGVTIGDFYGDEHLDIYVLQQGTDCAEVESAKVNGADILLVGPDWTYRPLWNHNLGCGDEALPLDGQLVLVSNGSDLSRGPLHIRDLRTEPPPED